MLVEQLVGQIGYCRYRADLTPIDALMSYVVFSQRDPLFIIVASGG